MGIWIFAVIIAVIGIFIINARRQRPKPTAAVSVVHFQIEDFKTIDSPELAYAAAKRVFPDQDQEAVLSMFERFKFRFSRSSGFEPRPDSSDIAELVRAVFPAHEVESVLGNLEKYGRKSFEIDKDRIRLDIIRLSDGNARRIPALVKAAKSDFRDTVITSEMPNDHAFVLKNPGARYETAYTEFRQVKDADLRQFGMWLLQYMK
jgi:hypothetical protein